jgi:fructokinase
MIVGIGELLWDVFPDGRKVAGGAPFNFAFHCRQLGHEAVIVSRVGDDGLGRELRDEVKRLGLSDEFIQTDRKRPTGSVRVSVGRTGEPSYAIANDVAWDHIEWTAELAELVRRAAVVCHGTLALRNKVSSNTILKAAMRNAARGKNQGLTVYDVNLRGGRIPEEAVRIAQWIKVNEDEYPRLEDCIDTMMDDDPWPRSLEGLFAYLRHFTKVDDRVWLVTRGADGAEVITDDAKRQVVRGVPAVVVDTVGAGDAFTAAMVCLHLEGRPLRDCARFANHYAARVCEHRGGTPRIDRAEVERAAFGSAR